MFDHLRARGCWREAVSDFPRWRISDLLPCHLWRCATHQSETTKIVILRYECEPVIAGERPDGLVRRSSHIGERTASRAQSTLASRT
jgi:hypothetical protein